MSGIDPADELSAALQALVAAEVARQLALLLPAAQSHAEPLPVGYLTTREAAAYAKLSPDTILKALQTGALFGSQRLKGGNWSIHTGSLDAWIHGTPDARRDAVERWKDGPKQPATVQVRRRRASTLPPSGDDAA